MPLFMFLAGMVFSLKFREFIPENFSFRDFLRELKKAFCGLFVPFVSWTVVYYFLRHNDGTLTYFKNVIKSPDYSLWFLITLFYCRVFFVFVLALFRGKKITSFTALLIVFYVAAYKLLPGIAGGGFFKFHFPYFALGIFFCKFTNKFEALLNSRTINIITFILFLIFAPLWYLTSKNPVELFLSRFMPINYAAKLYFYYKRAVPFLGITLFMSFARFLSRKNLGYVDNFLSFTGQLTLGIYAIHGTFIRVQPLFIASLAISIIITFVIAKIPVIRFFLLGKR